MVLRRPFESAECVAINMGDGELVYFWVTQQAGRMAHLAALFICLGLGQAIAAESWGKLVYGHGVSLARECARI